MPFNIKKKCKVTKYTNENPCIFIHSAKTAGGTFKHAIANTFSPDQYFFIYDDPKIRAKDFNNNYPLIYGHYIYGIHNLLNIKKPSYSTVVRHPVTRTLSHINHLKNVDDGKIGSLIRKYDNINDAIIFSDHWEISNFMCNVISGYANNKSVTDEYIYNKAIENIDNYFDFIGIYEYMQLTMNKISNNLGVLFNTSENINIGNYDFNGISQEAIDTLILRNKFDLKLYNYCVKRFFANLF